MAALLATACVAASFARFGFGPQALIAAFVSSVLVVLAVIDLEQRRLPNRIVVPSTLVALAAQAAFFPERIVECIAAALGAALFLLVPGLICRGGIGMGDVKLALLLGVALGEGVLVALLIAAFASLPAAAVILARAGVTGRRRTIPFGPFLAAGAVAALFLGSS